MFHVGQLVVCVDDSPGWTCHTRRVARGTIYTIGDIHAPTRRYPAGVQLVEVPPPHPGAWLSAARFSPVDDARLAIFRKALVSAGKPEPIFVSLQNSDAGRGM